jgi:hypothetical protein
MKDLVSLAVLICTIFAGTKTLGATSNEVRRAALTKASHGLPSLSVFATQLQSHNGNRQPAQAHLHSGGQNEKKPKIADRHSTARH